MKLVTIKKITGKVTLLTGLHIGAGNESTQIGGIDNPIIRQPRDSFPYIPGSSLKGKLRSLLELHLDRVADDGKQHLYRPNVCNAKDTPCPICHLFGAAAGEGAPIGPGRLIVRDCVIEETAGSNKRINEASKGLPFTEEKTEISINRIKCSVDGTLRKTERVPAGVEFTLDMSLRVMDSDNEKKLLDTLLIGMALLQMDALGGSGSRGYGKVKFDELAIDGQPLTLPEV